jgi:hypothetical protein
MKNLERIRKELPSAGPQFPLKKGGGAEGAGFVLIFEANSKDAEGARDSDSLILGFPVLQDNPLTAARPPSPPLTKGEFLTAPLKARMTVASAPPSMIFPLKGELRKNSVGCLNLIR